jgi:membrane-bound inhibitor of C-type lysozyme
MYEAYNLDMRKRNIIVAIVILIALFLALRHRGDKPQTQIETNKPISTATYYCDNNKSISAAYFEGEPVTVAEGEKPVPTGWVEVSIGGASTTTLNQTISGSGVRYANEDESLVFWNKGDEALIMRNNVMDMDYKNCSTAQKAVSNVSIEDYVTANISALSPEKEVLGGKFYVTKIEAHGGAGTVWYEDGHNAFVADFKYLINEAGEPSVTSFTLRK